MLKLDVAIDPFIKYAAAEIVDSRKVLMRSKMPPK